MVMLVDGDMPTSCETTSAELQGEVQRGDRVTSFSTALDVSRERLPHVYSLIAPSF